nr:hypothetical protein [uncultured Flavobacterium sp.]
MSKEIIYSFREYQEKYNSLLDEYFLEYEEIEDIDFIDNEIKNYQICLKLVNFPIDKIFNAFWRVEYGINLKAFSIPQEAYDFIYENENDNYYYKIYKDIVKPFGTLVLNTDVEKKIKQVRLMFPKIISFLETKKTELETNLKLNHDNIFSNNGFELFEYILKEYIKPKGVTGRQSDLIYYHRKMYDNNPQYIHRKPTEFFKWFDNEYSETSGQLVTYERVKSDRREKDYSTALEWFRLQK